MFLSVHIQKLDKKGILMRFFVIPIEKAIFLNLLKMYRLVTYVF